MSATGQQEHDPSERGDGSGPRRRGFRGLYTLLGVLVTPICLYIALLPMGPGHGTYNGAKVLYPWTMIAIFVIEDITLFLIALGIVQYPLYGTVIDWARARGRFKLAVLTLAAAHFSAVILAFSVRYILFR